mgnify:CR=1 FL=1
MEKLPKGIILAAHKPIASAMLKAATQIMGQIDHCAAAVSYTHLRAHET